jgi:hypothetical protein
MKKSDYQLIACIGAILSALFLFAGFYTGAYEEITIGLAGQGTKFAYPYAQYAPSLAICGIVSAVISALMWRASKATPTPA